MADLYLNNNKKPVVISVVSTKSGMGKTTLIEGLIRIFKHKDLKVGVLKHDAHKFDIDKEGKDSYRFSKAGADNVIVASSEKLAMIQILKEEKTVEEILPLFNNMDLVIIEGFKNNNYPKIEVHRRDVDENLLYNNPSYNKETYLAIASDEDLDTSIPVLDLNNLTSIGEFIEVKFLNTLDL
ncbi:molybdopterin-guanine dinucleotide biosynthesis protein B [Clostridium sp.]|uniref:molybdopterin-guanine dinucleotide biosynthesis protein B n=1 Tax=Clostridium sp. TaxID=1506 RepID=UPI003464C133